MNRAELEREGVDLKLVLLLLFKKISIVILSALAGAVVFTAVYGIRYYMQADARQYEAKSKYYIVFEEMMEKNYLDHYYNGYTWNDLLSSDLIIGYAMTLLPENYDREYVDDCVQAEILSDVRVLTTTVKADTAQEVVLIQEALEKAVVHFGTEGENLEQIFIIRSDAPVLENITSEFVRVALIGAAVCALLSIVVLLVVIAVQDAIYLPEEFTDRYGLPIAGVENCTGELEQNLAYLTKNKHCIPVTMQELLASSEVDYEKLRNSDGIVLRFPQGSANSKKLTYVIKTLEIQECKVVCAVMTDADPALIRRYYGW